MTFPRPMITIFALMALLGACSRTPPDLDDPSEYRTIVGDEQLYTEPTSFNDDIGLHARAARNVLILSWRNHRSGEIMVRAEDLALITGPDRDGDIHPFNTANVNMSRFTPLILQAGQSGVMAVEMRTPFPLAGTRLAYFNRRQELMARADVE